MDMTYVYIKAEDNANARKNTSNGKKVQGGACKEKKLQMEKQLLKLKEICDKQNEELKSLRTQLNGEKERADMAEKNAIAWKKKYEKAENDAQASQNAVWNLLLTLNDVTEFVFEQNSEYGKLCNKSYLDIQQMLGNERAGVESGEQRRDLLRGIHHFVSARTQEQETALLAAQSAPPENWQMGTEIQKLMPQMKKAFQPERTFRLLIEKLLVVLESGSAEQITSVLHSCGVDAVFYDDAPLEYKNPDFYGYYDSGIDVPALVGKKVDSGAPQVLSRGAHVSKVDRE